MLESAKINCPFCRAEMELEVDTSVSSQQFVTDCETCCRPMTVKVQSSPGEVLSIQVDSE